MNLPVGKPRSDSGWCKSAGIHSTTYRDCHITLSMPHPQGQQRRQTASVQTGAVAPTTLLGPCLPNRFRSTACHIRRHTENLVFCLPVGFTSGCMHNLHPVASTPGYRHSKPIRSSV